MTIALRRLAFTTAPVGFP
ncbi:unnamed protein product [Linum tenue]|uniref:Uncharacterized protein n=1 Tax=Linum tenue TaxID=586396 RepID=A0AAV0IWN8_9ROSI|nr:unnamed protein product [Linum tenue]